VDLKEYLGDVALETLIKLIKTSISQTQFDTSNQITELNKQVEELVRDIWGNTGDTVQLPVVLTFNGRRGDVVPTAGDYTPTMVGAAPIDHTHTAAEVKARPDTWMPNAEDVGALPADTAIPSKLSELTNDAGFITVSDTDTKISTAVNNLVNGAPETLDTIGEVATAINEHKEVTDALDAAIGKKVDKTTTINGKALSGNISLTASDVGAVTEAQVTEMINNALAPILEALKGV